MKKAPLFELEDQHGEKFVLADALKQGPVVVFFYPKDHTRVCSLEVRGFHALSEKFKDLGAQVVGISADSIKTHQEFAENCGPSIRLLSDRKNKVRRAFGVRKYRIVIPGRETFVIDQQGNIVKTIRHFTDHDVHIDEALEAVKAMSNRL